MKLSTLLGRAPHPVVPDDWRAISLDDVVRIPGMTHDDELRYFYWCCAKLHKRGRRVVELGPWVGRSSAAMVAGLRRSEDRRGKLVTIDYFKWKRWALDNSKDWTIGGLSEEQRQQVPPADLDPQLESSLLSIFRAYTAPFEKSLTVINADLDTYRWTGEPIDVLMIDAAKSWETFDQIVCQFFPCLADGAIILHQDFKHWFCYWLPAVTERMIERGILSPTEHVDGQPTHGFRFRRLGDFDPEPYLARSFTASDMDRVMANAIRRFQHDSAGLSIVGAYVRYLRSQRRDDEARRLIVQSLEPGNFCDNYALSDLVETNPREWTEPLVARLPARYATT